MSLEDKVVVVTGGTRGIGRAIAEACGAQGARLVVCARREEDVDEAVRALASAGIPVCGMPADVSSAEDLTALVENALCWYGRIDCWVNNAGISEGYRPLDELSDEEIDEIVRVNLTGTMLACRRIIPYFRGMGGVLLNMAGRGYRGEATPYTAAYAATKTAIASLTRSLAEENKRFPISIHALVPGMVPTDFYRDIRTSPRLDAARDNWRWALDAFGVPLDVVGRETARFLDQEPGLSTGKVHSLLKGRRLVRGIVRITGHRLAGRIKPEA